MQLSPYQQPFQMKENNFREKEEKVYVQKKMWHSGISRDCTRNEKDMNYITYNGAIFDSG